MFSAGNAFEAFPEALVGWGRGSFNIVADLNGDNKDDLVVVWHDQSTQTWRWHAAISLGYRFDPHADALTGVEPGKQLCGKDIDGDGNEELVAFTKGSPVRCFRYNGTTSKFEPVANCSASCP